MYINILFTLKLLTNIFLVSNFESNNYFYNNSFIKCSNRVKWNNHKNTISKIRDFKVNGVIIYKNGFKKIFLNFCWDNIYPKYFKFKAYTFFGIQLIEFIYNSENAYLKNYGIRISKGNNPQHLFEKISKTNIPVKNLRFWLIGLPGDSKKFILSNCGYLKEIEYNDKNKNYKIIYSKYNKNINPPLPEIIELHEGNSKINLEIKSWSFNK